MTNITQPAMIPGAREPGRAALAPTASVAVAASLTVVAPPRPCRRLAARWCDWCWRWSSGSSHCSAPHRHP